MSGSFAHKNYITFLEKEGFEYARSNGSHDIYKHPDGRVQNSVNSRNGSQYNDIHIKTLLAKINISFTEFQEKTGYGDKKALRRKQTIKKASNNFIEKT